MTNTKTARLIVLNVCWLAGVAWATAMGYTAFVFAGDKSLVSYPIAAIAVASAAASFWSGKYLMRAAWLCSCLGFLWTLIGLMAGVGLYCRWALLRLDAEDAAADERQKGIL